MRGYAGNLRKKIKFWFHLKLILRITKNTTTKIRIKFKIILSIFSDLSRNLVVNVFATHQKVGSRFGKLVWNTLSFPSNVINNFRLKIENVRFFQNYYQ